MERCILTLLWTNWLNNKCQKEWSNNNFTIKPNWFCSQKFIDLKLLPNSFNFTEHGQYWQILKNLYFTGPARICHINISWQMYAHPYHRRRNSCYSREISGVLRQVLAGLGLAARALKTRIAPLKSICFSRDSVPFLSTITLTGSCLPHSHK